jgi:hypothetical protein
MRRLILIASPGSFRFGVFSRKASSPPLKSIVRCADVVKRKRTISPNVSLKSDVVCTFGRKRRRVLLWAWLTLFPVRTPLPVIMQRRDIDRLLFHVPSRVAVGQARSCKRVIGPRQGASLYYVPRNTANISLAALPGATVPVATSFSRRAIRFLISGC